MHSRSTDSIAAAIIYESSRFVIRIDQEAMRCLLTSVDASSELARWQLRLLWV